MHGAVRARPEMAFIQRLPPASDAWGLCQFQCQRGVCGRDVCDWRAVGSDPRMAAVAARGR